MSVKRKVPLEKEIQKQIHQYLTLHGWLVIRLNSGAVVGEHNGRKRFVRFNDAPGVSDLLCIRDGRALFVEVKRPGKIPNEKQREFLDRALRHGAAAIWVQSIEQLIAALGQLDF